MPLLSVDKISKSFGGLQTFNDISIDIEKGNIVALIGPNGAGKTTLFNVLNGIDKPDSGRIFFNGERIDHLPPYRIMDKGVARTFQVVRLFKGMSVLENVMIGRHIHTKAGVIQVLGRFHSARSEEIDTRERAMIMLRVINLADRADHEAEILPHGQQRLVELARMLVSEPKLLLLDEPCGGLNSKEIFELQNLLKLVKRKGITVFLIEHRMHLVMNISDKVVVLSNGRKIAEGPPNTIRNDKTVIDAYLGKDTLNAEC
jgi:branched-chain amino acid transport system ATP-binding protein